MTVCDRSRHCRGWERAKVATVFAHVAKVAAQPDMISRDDSARMIQGMVLLGAARLKVVLVSRNSVDLQPSLSQFHFIPCDGDQS